MPLEPLVMVPTLQRRAAAAWDARRNCYWLLVFDAMTGAGRVAGLWRGGPDGRFEPVCHGTDVLPEGVETLQARLLVDAAGDLHLFASDPRAEGDAGFHARFDGTRFAPLPMPPAAPASAAIALDPKRGVLVLVAFSDGAIYERRGDAFQAVGSLGLDPSHAYYHRVAAGWDEVRGRLVLLHNSAESTIRFHTAKAWDGARLEDLPAPPDVKVPEVPHRTFGATHPVTGQAVFIGRDVGALVLEKKGFKKLDTGVAINWLHDVSAGPGTIELWGASLYYESAVRQRITWDGKTWKRHGAPIPGWGKTVDRSRHLSFFSGHLMRLNTDGDDVEGLQGWEEGGFTRSEATLVWDSTGGRALISAGMGPPYNKSTPARDTWEWREGAGWKEIKTKGKPAARVRGQGIWVPFRREMLVVGGMVAKRHASDPATTTEHFDGQRWTAFDTCFEGVEEHPKITMLAADPTSAQVIAADTKGAGVRLWCYRGEGRWQAGPTIEITGVPGGPAGVEALDVDFDPGTRRLIAKGPPLDERGTEGLFATDLSTWLDSLTKAGTGAGAAAAPPAGAPKKDKAAPAKAKEKVEAPPAPAERFLWYREDGVGKFWFAKLDGLQWTATWGRRGAQGQSKTYTLPTAEKARADFEKKVRSKLDEGYQESDRGAEIAKLAGRDAWTIKRAKKSTVPDRLGGLPPLAPKDVPVCKGCSVPMTLLALFHADAERLPLGAHAALAIFQCESNQGQCSTWEPDGGANAALLLEAGQLVKPQKPSEKTTEIAASGIAYTRATEVDAQAEGLDEPSPGGSKIGGFATWVQYEEIPSCSTCAQPMQFVAQLEADDVGANFGDCGVGYAFVCPGHGAKFLWQCS